MPRSRRRRRSSRAPTRRLQPRQRLSTPVLCAGLRCPTPRLSNSTLRANTPSPLCRRSWWTCRPEAGAWDGQTNRT